MNFDIQNSFEGGYSKDLAENLERNNTFSLGKNGRVYSKNGVFGFSSIEGSKVAYQNNNIVKWLGGYSFREQSIVFAKCLKPTNEPGLSSEEVCEQVLFSEEFKITSDVEDGFTISLSNLISDSSQVIESCYTVTKPLADPTDFITPYSEVTEEAYSVDFGEYYNERFNVANYDICNINTGQTPINNETYFDCILSFSENEEGVLVGKRLWIGMLNLPMNGKITAEGVEENQFYKRVYLTDAINPRRVVNVKDVSLSTRNPEEFSQILDNSLLQPEIKKVEDGGQLKAMRSMYIYRIISEQGQVSEFSPFSKMATVVAEDEGVRYRGGKISETTGKVVRLACNLLEPEASAEIECMALEFEAFGPPTAIRNLGIKRAAPVVSFDHFGNEPELIDNVTIQDILEFKNTWKYANDYSSEKNKLIAGGLRNSPIPTALQGLDYLFPLHSWDKDGNTFESLINPSPWEFQFVDPGNKNPLIYIKRKKYDQISSFGPTVINLAHKYTGANISIPFYDLDLDKYTDLTEDVLNWLLTEQAGNAQFNEMFPNLLIEDNNGQILFSPIDDTQFTDISNYIFKSKNDQFIESFSNEIVFFDVPVSNSRLVHGAESIGFNQGNGVRISYREFKEPLLRQANEPYSGSGKILDYMHPSMENYCMKGEIYRLGFQAYDQSSSRYFTIPLGDVQVPSLDDAVTSINDQGNAVITSKKYVNQSVENGVLYGHGVKMHIEVRLDCEMQKLISMYQIVYVERTEENRTILCQGIAAPLFRMQFDGSPDQKMPEQLLNKWVLPYYGGPVYEKDGLKSYDEFGENYDYQGTGQTSGNTEQYYKKTMTSRKLMYFDSPDLYYRKISDQYVKSSEVEVVSKLNTDHNPKLIMERGGFNKFPAEKYPKFSRKITEDYLEGDLHLDQMPRLAREERGDNNTYETYFINVSVFAKSQVVPKKRLKISHAESLLRGEIISGEAFELNNDVSNNAIAMPCMPWFFSPYQKRSDDQEGKSRADMFREATVSPGYPTTIIKTQEDLFTKDFVGPDIFTVDSEIRVGGVPHTVYETYPLINLVRSNRESVYGGRSAQAYSRNTFIPLSRTIPVSKNGGVQMFDCGADTYITLNIRNKNDAGDIDVTEEIEIDNGGGGRNKGEIKTFRRNGAWNYVCVLETQVEPKLDPGYYFYRESGTFRFDILREEVINKAYFNDVTLKQFIAKPFKFKDDPNLGNVIAVSNVKVAGEPYDSWTMFKPNNYYPSLDKNKGDISNLVKSNGQIFAIQEDQTSLIYIGEDRIINDAQGVPINIKQGSGEVVGGHKVISPYGTSIRRAVAVAEDSFSFFDEKNVEFVKINKPLLAPALLHLDYWNRVKNNPIVDCDAYYDHANKETVIRVRQSDGSYFTLAYNDALGLFNGEHEHNNDWYMMFGKKVYSPVLGNPKILHQHNEGDYLNLFNQQKLLRVGVTLRSEGGKVIQYKKTGIISNLEYPFSNIIYKTSLGQSRIVTGNHNWYKLREGNHSVPAKNESEVRTEMADLRGTWVTVELTAESKNKNKIDILAIINHLRFSHQ